MSKDLQEIKEELHGILNKWDGEGRFTIHTMKKIEDDARDAKVLIAESHLFTKEMYSELDTAIEISGKYHREKLGLENEIIREALRHLEWGIQLFFNRI